MVSPPKNNHILYFSEFVIFIFILSNASRVTRTYNVWSIIRCLAPISTSLISLLFDNLSLLVSIIHYNPCLPREMWNDCGKKLPQLTFRENPQTMMDTWKIIYTWLNTTYLMVVRNNIVPKIVWKRFQSVENDFCAVFTFASSFEAYTYVPLQDVHSKLSTNIDIIVPRSKTFRGKR